MPGASHVHVRALASSPRALLPHRVLQEEALSAACAPAQKRGREHSAGALSRTEIAAWVESSVRVRDGDERAPNARTHAHYTCSWASWPRAQHRTPTSASSVAFARGLDAARAIPRPPFDPPAPGALCTGVGRRGGSRRRRRSIRSRGSSAVRELRRKGVSFYAERLKMRASRSCATPIGGSWGGSERARLERATTESFVCWGWSCLSRNWSFGGLCANLYHLDTTGLGC